MKIFSKIFNKSQASETEILNSGLDFAMEFGENFLKPIQGRLSKKYRFLNETELDNYNLICKSAKDEGQKYIYDFLEKLSTENNNISENNLKNNLSNFIREKYSWISENNLNRLFSQACYFAYKDGLDEFIKQ